MSKTKRSLFSLAAKIGFAAVGAAGIDEAFGHVIDLHGGAADLLHADIPTPASFVPPEMHLPPLHEAPVTTDLGGGPMFDAMGVAHVSDAFHATDVFHVHDIPGSSIDHIVPDPAMATGVDAMPTDIHDTSMTASDATLQDLGYHPSNVNADFASGNQNGWGQMPKDIHGNGPQDGQGNNPYRNGQGNLPGNIWGGPW